MDNRYGGLTVNERLYVSSLLSSFDEAVKEKDIETVIEILKKVEITDDSTINHILIALGLSEK